MTFQLFQQFFFPSVQFKGTLFCSHHKKQIREDVDWEDAEGDGPWPAFCLTPHRTRERLDGTRKS